MIPVLISLNVTVAKAERPARAGHHWRAVRVWAVTNRGELSGSCDEVTDEQDDLGMTD